MGPDGVVVRAATLEEILELRRAVLIVGTHRSSAEYPEDRDADTLHVGAFVNGDAVGCATFLRSEWEGRPAWQLRGMATAPEWRSMGIGGRVLAFGEERLWRTSEVRELWCNARLRAVPFYERHGWRAVTDAFDIAGVGPHRRMVKSL